MQITIFGSHEGQLTPGRNFYLTVFGSCEQQCPTIAQQLMAQRQLLHGAREAPVGQKPLSDSWGPMGKAFATASATARAAGNTPNRPFFFTVFGSTQIKFPTLAAEFLDLRKMLNSGMLSRNEWDGALSDIASVHVDVGSFTLFGSLERCKLPTENEEVDSLAIQRHLGNISENAGTVLQYGIGRSGAERHAALQQALVAMA